MTDAKTTVQQMIQRTETAKDDFAKSIADYIMTHADYPTWSRERAATEAVRVLTDDIGAAQRFLDLIGVKVDLYEEGSLGQGEDDAG